MKTATHTCVCMWSVGIQVLSRVCVCMHIYMCVSYMSEKVICECIQAERGQFTDEVEYVHTVKERKYRLPYSLSI